MSGRVGLVRVVSVKLLDFLATGWFGPLRAGSSRAEVEAVLGDPDGWGDEPVQRSPIWVYGDFEFHFGDPIDRAWMIYSDQPEPRWPRPSPALRVDPWVLRMGMRMDEVRAALADHGLAYDEFVYPDDG